MDIREVKSRIRENIEPPVIMVALAQRGIIVKVMKNNRRMNLIENINRNIDKGIFT